MSATELPQRPPTDSRSATRLERLRQSVHAVLRTPADQVDLFGRFSSWTAQVAGGRWAFLLAALTIVVWAASGPFFHFSATWQLVINTGTTIVTFLMVFLIQNSQNRDAKAIQLKLDELILAVRHADNQLIDIESLTETQLDQIRSRYQQLAEAYHSRLERKVGEVEEQVDEVEEKVEDVEEKVDDVDEQVEALGREVDRLKTGPRR